jgi:hypothetical protein
MLISETMARRFWPDEDPVGRSLKAGGENWEVVGVVSDAPFHNVADLPEPYLYLPYWQAPRWDLTLLVDAAGDRAAMAKAVRQALVGVDRSLEPASIAGLEELIAYSASEKRMMAVLAAVLAGLGLTLTAAGLYGVLSYAVARRRREIGIRMALGASKGETVALVAAESARVAGTGLLVGTPLALGGGFALRSFLFGVAPWSPAVLGGAVGLVCVVAMVACLAPAARAAEVQPQEALRAE